MAASLASCRKGSGVLPAGRLEGLRCFTIRKANGKNKSKKQPDGCSPFDSLLVDSLYCLDLDSRIELDSGLFLQCYVFKEA
ncbi:hypothetical protein [Peribacillus sp. TH14]|uniref:hypothetical protein n=1 Tax=Peribacillus sp. TH14 TaxID=2798481 RepID=UPI0019116050|nr:hypothetical protein [Peribacillus sp. TH14]MBK5502628.1 hypothetical protein [Peribacillus sp. TH14]